MDPLPTLLKNLASLLAVLRGRTGLSQEHFADAIKIHRTEMGRLEQAKTTPRLDTLYKVAGGLGLSVSELLAMAERGGGGAATARVSGLPGRGRAKRIAKSKRPKRPRLG
jgi:transcriptional regulator with XRE-family HTH domain